MTKHERRPASAEPGARHETSDPEHPEGQPPRQGVLLVNLGTPDAPTPAAVRRYLREFLSDQRVVDLSRWLWLPILYGIILPWRPRRVAHAYATVWTPEGSPLLAISKRQARGLEQRLEKLHPSGIPVRVGMVYGNPSILEALRSLRQAGCDTVVFLPLYPQYSSPTVGSAEDVVARAHATDAHLPRTIQAPVYFDAPKYIRALAATVRRYHEQHGRAQHLLMSFHGLPQRYVDNGDPYRDHCVRTAELVAAELGLVAADWTLSFQSRFGREEWLQPYTDETLRAWGRQGRTDVDVLCPGFAADCLETLEEIAIQNRRFFEQAGGRGFRYIPALNDEAEHLDLLADLVREKLTHGGSRSAR